MPALLEPPVRKWACPSCTTVDLTKRPDAHTQMHHCEGLHGFIAPLVEVQEFDSKVDARHLLLDREDYIGDSGADPIASCRTDHGDGSNDCTVYAPTAVIATASYPPGAIDRVMGPGQDITVNPGVADAGAGARMHHRFYDPKLERMARLARKFDLQMAWTTSNVNAYYLWAMGQATSRPNPTSDSFKVALYGTGVTPAQSTTAALTQYNGAGSTWVTANETTNTSGSAYVAGGAAVTPVSWTQATNVVTFSSSGSPQWTTASFTAAGGLVYDTTVTSQAISWNYFGGAQTVAAGTFTIAWNASGILTLTS